MMIRINGNIDCVSALRHYDYTTEVGAHQLSNAQGNSMRYQYNTPVAFRTRNGHGSPYCYIIH